MISQEHFTAHVGHTSPTMLSPLKYQRLLRGWTQQDVADELYKLCVAHGRSDAGINAERISRWECGVARPSLFYQKYLCLLYGMTTDKLGLLHDQGGASMTAKQRSMRFGCYPLPYIRLTGTTRLPSGGTTYTYTVSVSDELSTITMTLAISPDGTVASSAHFDEHDEMLVDERRRV